MKFGKMWLIALIAVVGVFCAGNVSAAESNEPQWLMRPIEKVSRGIANVAFSVFELPMQWANVTREDGGVAGITKGTLKGVCYVIARIGVGVIDVVTFPFPLPDCPNYPEDAGWGYGPFFTPEWILTPATDPYNVAYPQTGYLD